MIPTPIILNQAKKLALPPLLYAAGILLFVAIFMSAGYKIGAWRYGAQLEQLKADHAEQRESWEKKAADAEKTLRAQLQAAQVRADDAVLSYDQNKTQANKTKLEIQKRSESHVYQPYPGAKPRPLPECVTTRDWLRDYNRALGLSATNSTTAAKNPTATPAASKPTASSAAKPSTEISTGLEPTNIRQPELLQHSAEYGAYCQNIEAQLNALIDFLEANPSLKDQGD